jgi:uncharacterized protein with GYD domain
MPTFLLLTTLSTQGTQTLSATPERLLEVNRELESMGAEVRQQWALLGPYDFLTVVIAADERTVLAAAAQLAARGSAAIETLPAVEIDDLVAMLASNT